jgi:hypothetical protein
MKLTKLHKSLLLFLPIAVLASSARAGVLSIAAPIDSPAPLNNLLPPTISGDPTVSGDDVIPGSTFSIAVVGFSASNGGSYLTAAEVVPFGGTYSFSGAALGGQMLTVTSSEVDNGTTTTDTFTISVPTNFCPTGTLVGSPGSPCTNMEADIGGYNAGADPVKFSSNVSSATVTGGMIYSGGPFTLNPAGNSQFTNGGMSWATAEGVNAGGSNLAQFDINQFNFSISYPASPVPEPASAGLLVSAALAGLLMWRRRL